MSAISPTAEGFRAAFRRPSLAMGEISWRWITGATASALFFFGLFEYLDTLPVSNVELLFLRSRQPYLIAQAISHILRGSLGRVVASSMVAVLLLSFLWIVAGSLGRIATVRAMLDYFRDHLRRDVAGDVSTASAWNTLVRLNFLRTVVALAALIGFVGAMIIAGFVSPDSHPRPGMAFLLFLPMAALVFLAWTSLNWLLALAGMFAVRDGEDAIGAIAAAVGLCRDRLGAVAAVSTWTGLAHLVAFVGTTTIISVPLGFLPLLPWRLVVVSMILITLVYFALADWLYTARLAGYVCIAELPEEMLRPPVLPLPVPSCACRERACVDRSSGVDACRHY
ncbi:MAG TPA: hypothetical protein VMH04_24230 [Candidatus Solibacter sp.]|nr:hypothetical protein [Candidatus Solibacter sp.]